MTARNNLGLVLLGLWLVLSGLFAVLDVRTATASLLLNVLVVAVGAVLLFNTSAARNRNPGFILLAIALLGRGLLAFLSLRIAGLGAILDLLLFGAGVLLWVGARGRKLSRYPGILLLGLWLIATGLVGLLSINFLGFGLILSLLAIAAGVLVLLDR